MVMVGEKPVHEPENEQVCLVVFLQAWCQEDASKMFEVLEAACHACTLCLGKGILLWCACLILMLFPTLLHRNCQRQI